MAVISSRPISLAVKTAVLTAEASPEKAMMTSLEWLVPLLGVIYLMRFTFADFKALSAITRPMAAGEPAMNPKALPSGALNAAASALPALAE